MPQPTQNDSFHELSARLEHFQSGERAAAEKRAAEILALSVNHDWTDLFGRLILWALLVPDDARKSRNDQVSLDPVAEYIICWLYAQPSGWDAVGKPAVTPLTLAAIINLGQEQIDRSWLFREQRSEISVNQEASAEYGITIDRESFELLAGHELHGSTCIRYPLHPFLWHKYLASIYGPLRDDLQRTLGFDYTAIETLTDALRRRLRLQVSTHIDVARSFHEAAIAATKRLRRGRTLQGFDVHDAQLFQEFASMRPSESKAAIHWHAMHRTLDESAALVSIADTDDDVVQAVGADSVRALLKSATLPREKLNPAQYVLPNPSPQVQYTPFIQCGPRALVVNPTSLSYYADNIFWEASTPHHALQEKISAQRARFTQSHTAECLRLVFGPSTVLEEVAIFEAGTNAKVGEFDVLVTSTAGILAIECKSGRWSRAAQRGSVASIKTRMDELYFKAIYQVGDRIQRLRNSEGLVLRDKHQNMVVVDWRAAPLCIGMVVHLAPIDALHAHSYLTPSSPYADAVDALVLSGLTYLETACHTLGAPGLLLDYLFQRGRLSADKRAGAADENEWLAFYLETGLRMKTFSEQGATLGHLSANTAQLDAFIYSGFQERIRPKSKIASNVLSLIESVRDQRIQLRVVSVIMEQSPENDTRLGRWIDCRGRSDATNRLGNELVVLYSADGSRAIAMYFISDESRETRSGQHVDRLRELLRHKPDCVSGLLLALTCAAGFPQTRDAFDLALT